MVIHHTRIHSYFTSLHMLHTCRNDVAEDSLPGPASECSTANVVCFAESWHDLITVVVDGGAHECKTNRCCKVAVGRRLIKCCSGGTGDFLGLWCTNQDVIPRHKMAPWRKRCVVAQVPAALHRDGVVRCRRLDGYTRGRRQIADHVRRCRNINVKRFFVHGVTRYQHAECSMYFTKINV